MNPQKLLAAIPLAVMTALAAVAPNAHAQCGMGEVDWYGAERNNVSQAEELLKEGEPKKAAWVLQQTWPRMHEALPREGGVPVIADGVRLMAVAAVRSDGDVRSGNGWSSATAAERAANVAWGIRHLRMLLSVEPWNLAVKTDLGEALSRSPATRDEARTILEALDDDRAVSSAEGYAALAMLRLETGDTAGAETAGLACERFAGTDVNRCAAAGGRVTPVLTATR